MTDQIIRGSQSSVSISDPTNVGECRRTAKRVAEAYDFDETSIGRASIVATELATNIQRHAGTGILLIQMLDDGVHPELELLAIDRGAGMPDVDRCMQDGYSTNGTAGNGLGAIARQSSTFDLFSLPGQGTVVLSRIAKNGIARNLHSRPNGLELGAICLAVAGELECGDTWRVASGETHLSMFIADGVGHGPLAATASTAAAAAFSMSPFDAPASIMTTFHRALAGTRGAAAACALARFADSKIDYAGVGNICGAVVTEQRPRGMVSHNGTLGTQLLRIQQFEYPWPAGSPIVMHSDGLSARWNLAGYAGLQQRHAAIIAGVLYRDFGRQRDDVTVLVARQRT